MDKKIIRMASLQEVVNCLMSKWKPETSGFPQVSVLGSAQCNIFFGIVGSGIECSLSRFASDTELCSAVTTLVEGMCYKFTHQNWVG